MRYRKIYVTAALIFVLLAIAGASWLLLKSRSQPEDTKDKVATGEFVAACNLIEAPDKYVSKTVRVRGIIVGFHQLALYEPACSGNNSIPVELDPRARQELIASVDQLRGPSFQRIQTSLQLGHALTCVESIGKPINTEHHSFASIGPRTHVRGKLASTSKTLRIDVVLQLGHALTCVERADA